MLESPCVARGTAAFGREPWTYANGHPAEKLDRATQQRGFHAPQLDFAELLDSHGKGRGIRKYPFTQITDFMNS
ncbi:hypothetical protein SPHV1_2190016 [Novosphingobium sp. KN65.2]|nr:hypothetical protein SPHV1_2190016 [Novosphingobium sp. KN65.2]